MDKLASRIIRVVLIIIFILIGVVYVKTNDATLQILLGISLVLLKVTEIFFWVNES